MKHRVHALAVAALLMPGSIVPTAASPMPPPVATTMQVTRVNFLDRLLQGNTAHRRKPSSHRAHRPPIERHAEADVSGSPAGVPIPQARPADAKASPPALPETPKPPPEAKPETNIPIPAQKPQDKPPVSTPPSPPAASGPGLPSAGEQNKETAKPPLPAEQADSELTIEHEDPAALKACLSELETLGARFKTAEPIDEGNGCGIGNPIKVDEVLPGLSLGGAVMRCGTALGLAHWLKNSVQPALDIAKPGRKITGMAAGTTFACRLRNNASSGVISEHARGTAFDVAAFKLDNGETIEMTPRQDDHTIEGAFQKAATAGACLYFTTVLAPGSDDAHETHMHIDIKDRKNGYRICESM